MLRGTGADAGKLRDGVPVYRRAARQLGSTGVREMVWRCCVQAGLTQARAHRLRHALATELLDRGYTLPEIGQVLRQRELAKTAVYAKVDHAALRKLARLWPAGAR